MKPKTDSQPKEHREHGNKLKLPTEEITKLYEEGKSLTAIAKIFGCRWTTIRARLIAEGISRRSAGGSSLRTEVGELAAREGISRQAAWYRLRKATGNPRGRPRTEAAEMAEREGISSSTAWFRLHKATGRPRGRPRKQKAPV